MSESPNKGITRRGFTLGSLAVGAAAAVASGVSAGCSNDQVSDGEPQVVTDDSQITNVTEEYENVDTDLAAVGEWSLPLGTLLFHTGGSFAAAMLTPESAQYPNSLGVLALGSGNLTTVLAEPTKGSKYGFYEVCCSDSVFAWTEIDYASHSWSLMAQGLSNGALSGGAEELDSGDSDYDAPLFTVSGKRVVWYHMPSTSGSKTAETSYCYMSKLGDSEPTEVWKSTGRFACRPRVSDGVLTITPRVRNDDGTYYGMTAIELDDDLTQRAQLVLPSSVRPFEVSYMNELFVFSIEAAYSGVGSLGNMGTFIGKEGGPYVFLSREPLAAAAGNGSRYLIKVQSSHFVVDTEAKTFSTLLSPDRALDYGDYPASAGTTSSFLVYSTIRGDTGIPESVTARLFSI